MREGEYDSSSIGPIQATVFRTNEQIEEDLRELIEENDLIEPKDIEIIVESGRVILKGKVRDFDAKKEAQTVAFETMGVTEVYNELEITG